jgi:hypothetical protein
MTGSVSPGPRAAIKAPPSERTSPHYRPSGARALRSGLLGIIIRPAKGSLSSNRKIAHDADNAKSERNAKTVALMSANRLKLANMMTSRKTSTAKNGIGIELSDSTNSSSRVRARLVLTCTARAWSDRCTSLRGESA